MCDIYTYSTSIPHTFVYVRRRQHMPIPENKKNGAGGPARMRLRASDTTAHRETEKQSSKSMIGRLSNHGLQLIPCVFCGYSLLAETVLLLLPLLSALLTLRASVNRVKIKTKALSLHLGGGKENTDRHGGVNERMDPRAAHANSFVGIQHSRWALTAAQRPTDSPRPRPPLAASDWPPGPSPPPRA